MRGSENKPLRVAVYCRVGKADQIDLDVQVRAYTEQVNSHAGWKLEAVYTDIGVPGYQICKQRELCRLLADCREGKIDKIMVKSLPRLSRNVQNCSSIVRELSCLGVSIRFEKENIDTENADQWSMLNSLVMATAAMQESVAAESDSIDDDDDMEL